MTNEIPQVGFLQIIEKASQLENIDVDKLAKMMEMQLKWEDRQNENLFYAAKSRIREKLSKFKIYKKRSVAYDVDKNDKSKGQKEAFKYAALEDIDTIIKPILEEEKMDVSFDIEPNSNAGWHNIVCILAFAGHKERYKMPMPLDTSGGKGNAQAMGSTQSYGWRRALCGAFNIVVIGEDDDGSCGVITDKQTEEIKNGFKESGLDVAKVLNSMKVDCVENIKVKDFGRVQNLIKAKLYDNLKKEGKKDANIS
jgi:hypothetical protein